MVMVRGVVGGGGDCGERDAGRGIRRQAGGGVGGVGGGGANKMKHQLPENRRSLLLCAVFGSMFQRVDAA